MDSFQFFLMWLPVSSYQATITGQWKFLRGGNSFYSEIESFVHQQVFLDQQVKKSKLLGVNRTMQFQAHCRAV